MTHLDLQFAIREKLSFPLWFWWANKCIENRWIPKWFKGRNCRNMLKNDLCWTAYLFCFKITSLKTLMFPLYFDKLKIYQRSFVIAKLWFESWCSGSCVTLLMWKNSFHKIIIRKKDTKYVDTSWTIIWKIAIAQSIGLYLNLHPSFKNATLAENSKQLLMIHHRI